MVNNQANGENTNERNDGVKRSNRGFAAMDPELQRQIASKGGQAAHEQGRAHEFTPEEARAAGRKGGEVVSQNREHMAEIGRKGGQSRGNANRRNNESSNEEVRRNDDRGSEEMRSSE
jgi:uncharacterized protein